tara:strand:- start:384 stop:740 length:357 start_codon:yes stop_codon:yes gene_type:complete
MSELLKDMSANDIRNTLSSNQTITYSRKGEDGGYFSVTLEDLKWGDVVFFSLDTATKADIQMVKQQVSKIHNLHLFSYELDVEKKALPRITETKFGKKSMMFRLHSNQSAQADVQPAS